MKLLKIIVFSAGIVFSICLYSQNLQKYLLQSPVNYININGEEFVKRDLNAMLNYLFINVNFSEHSAEAEYEWINFYSRPHPSVKTLRKYFAQAAYEFKVPQQLLEIIAYTESNWTQIGPSIDRGWGIMHLVQNDYTNTLGEAASLINVKPEILKNNAQLNIRGAAALISKYAGNNKKYFTKYEDWFDALLSFTGLINEELKQKQVITYYHNLCNGVVSNTLWDETIEIAAIPNIDISSKIKSYSSQPKNITTVDYAPAIAGFISCNYATGRSHIIDTWVNHWIGVGTYAGAISWFNNCNAQASAHFVIRASDGEITQCVNISNTAWHCGASGYPNNSRSIGVEHEATSSNPNLWNSTYMLSASANMACYFASKYSIPSSFHTSPGICGHNEMPGTNTACPGTLPWTSWINLYNSCMASSQGPINLTANVSNCPSKNVTFSWTNSGNGWYIALSTDINFGQYYWKWVSGLTSYTGPAGFVDHIDNSPLVFQNGLTYYWKIWNGSNYTSVKQFSIPMC
ncbi:MAG TPA: N-acetylmuramoyl-L-alanine amidase, partial [Bacteroidales bacterium]|nr:N-acetylmuramoyl-L-alanine amidase [Bacteroidales bacterium]